jgi:hypothetical protein
MNPPKARQVIFDGSAQGFISRLRRRLPSAVTGKERLVRTYVETQKASTDFWRVHLNCVYHSHPNLSKLGGNLFTAKHAA